jgi:hypothetical protein
MTKLKSLVAASLCIVLNAVALTNPCVACIVTCGTNAIPLQLLGIKILKGLLLKGRDLRFGVKAPTFV